MQTVFKGSINFGLVNIPVKLFSATAKGGISFRSLHKLCKTPIKQKRWCPHCDKEVEYTDLTKGYEYEKNSFVEVTDEDLKKLPIKSNKYIQIEDFISLDEIDPIYYDKAYYTAPETNGEKPYQILYNAMKSKGRVAIAKISIRDKEQLCVIRVYEDILLINTMFFSKEVRHHGIDTAKIHSKQKTSELENKMAAQIVETLTQQFNPEKYHDAYQAKFDNLVQAKLSGNQILTASPTSQDDYKDLADRLKQSLQALTTSTEKTKKSTTASKSAKAKKSPKIPPTAPPPSQPHLS